MKSKALQVGNGVVATSAGFRFDDRTLARNFSRHVSASVPGYETLQELIGILAPNFAKRGSSIVDLGCADGRATIEVAKAVAGRGISVIGVDSSLELIVQARRRSKKLGLDCSFVWADATKFVFPKNVSLVLAVYFLQFLDVAARAEVLFNIDRNLDIGGGLIVAEKVFPREGRWAQMFENANHIRKSRAGFSGDQILGKLESLSGILMPVSDQEIGEEFDLLGMSREVFFSSLAFRAWVGHRRTRGLRSDEES